MTKIKSMPVLLICLAAIPLPGTADAQPSYTEDFSDTAYMDAVRTTADWNTGHGQLMLPVFVPYQVGSCELPTGLRGAALSGDFVLIAGQGPGIHIVDISDPMAPVHLTTIDTPGGNVSPGTNNVPVLALIVQDTNGHSLSNFR